MVPPGIQSLGLASCNTALQGRRGSVAGGHSRAQIEIKAPLVSPQEASHALPAASLGSSCLNASLSHHMPESSYIARATALAAPTPAELQGGGASGTHAPYLRQGWSATASAGGGTHLHSSLQAATGISAASLAAGEHLHLLPKSKRSLVCLIF